MFDMLDPDEWQELEDRLRDAFDLRDGVLFEIVLMRLQGLLACPSDLEHVPGRLTQ
jgi:hypothetical protein